jgi:hypothetical protein
MWWRRMGERKEGLGFQSGWMERGLKGRRNWELARSLAWWHAHSMRKEERRQERASSSPLDRKKGFGPSWAELDRKKEG